MGVLLRLLWTCSRWLLTEAVAFPYRHLAATAAAASATFAAVVFFRCVISCGCYAYCPSAVSSARATVGETAGGCCCNVAADIAAVDAFLAMAALPSPLATLGSGYHCSRHQLS